jgi:hypothetical protein
VRRRGNGLCIDVRDRARSQRRLSRENFGEDRPQVRGGWAGPVRFGLDAQPQLVDQVNVPGIRHDRSTSLWSAISMAGQR